jgi:hypothetical protein
MSSTTFVDNSTVIYADWLNDVNSVAYNGTFVAATISPTNIVVNGSVSGTGFTGLVDNVLASPPVIGSGTANSASFTAVKSVTAGSLPVLQDSTGSKLQTLSATGYQKLPNGLIIQWGYSSIAPGVSGGTTVTFPITFPTAFTSISTQVSDTITSTVTTALLISSVSNSSVKLGTTYASGNLPVYWTAIGY